MLTGGWWALRFVARLGASLEAKPTGLSAWRPTPWGGCHGSPAGWVGEAGLEAWSA